MRQVILTLLSLFGLAAASQGQTIVLDDFSGTTGQVVASSSWNNNITLSNGTLTVAGTAKDDNGWAWMGSAINATGMNYVLITAQRDAGHDAATSFAIQFEDSSLKTKVFSINTSFFQVGTLSTVAINIGNWGIINPAQITGWSIGGGSEPGSLAYRMTFDNLALSDSLPAIPEPATSAAILGLFGLGCAVVVRLRTRRS